MTSALGEYLKATGETASSFAGRVGTSVSTITRIASGAREPRLGLARKICEAAGGQITFAMLSGLEAFDPTTVVPPLGQEAKIQE